MDYIPPYMFHFDQTDDHDLLLQVSSTPQPQRHTIQQDDLLLNPTSHDANNRQSNKSDCIQQRKASNTNSAGKDENSSESKKRKIMHRDIERQRRQEMATLYRALRSLLPLDYLKGKRSISDHMYEAVKYIKDLQNRIQELSERRDGLQRFSGASASSFASGCLPVDNHPEDCVTVRPCLAGVEVVVSTALTKGLPLSRVLEVLTGEDLNIINCISTKMNERLLHTIQSEVNDGRTIDMCDLQQKIMKLTTP